MRLRIVSRWLSCSAGLARAAAFWPDLAVLRSLVPSFAQINDKLVHVSRCTRRGFLKSSVFAGAASLPLAAILSRSANAQVMPFGPLVRDPEGILDLPAGFTYRILDREGDRMSDGIAVPPRHDGMAAIELPDGMIALMRNHENDSGSGPGPFPETYRPEDRFQGGVTRVVVDPSDYSVVSSNLVLHGTARNCAGGRTPDAWLSCEEDTTRGHGFVFRCPATASRVTMPQRIDGYGRFNHEAVAYDQDTGIAYLTEDRSDGCLYRFVPDSPSDPFGDGQLFALRVVGRARVELGDESRGSQWDIDWVPLDDPSSPDDSLRDDAQDMGAAVFRRGEGIDFDGTRVFVCTTRGGPVDRGQIFLLDPTESTLEIVGESPNTSILDSPDNIVVAPWGDIVMAEDPSDNVFIRGLDGDGQIYNFARNAQSDSEFAGVCFSPRGDALFVNAQSDGVTFVIQGPFPQPAPVVPSDGGVLQDDAGDAQTRSASDAGAVAMDADGDCGCSTPGMSERSNVSTGALVGGAAVSALAMRSGTRQKKNRSSRED